MHLDFVHEYVLGTHEKNDRAVATYLGTIVIQYDYQMVKIAMFVANSTELLGHIATYVKPLTHFMHQT